jgi:hypothetical protein
MPMTFLIPGLVKTGQAGPRCPAVPAQPPAMARRAFTAAIPALAVGAAQWGCARALASTCVSLVCHRRQPGCAGRHPLVRHRADHRLQHHVRAAGAGNYRRRHARKSGGRRDSVGFTESLYSYEPAGTDGKQPPPRLLAQSTPTAISGVNGLVSIQPLQQAGTAGTAVITAALGSRTAGTWTLLAEPTVAPVTSGPVTPRKLPLPR